MDKSFRSAFFSLIVNIACCIYHITFGAMMKSWWLLNCGTYYFVLSMARFFVIIVKKGNGFVAKLSGVMLMALSVSIAGTVILNYVNDRGEKLHEIVAITLAVYAFSKITIAAVKMVKYWRASSVKLTVLRHISFASALVSIFSLQRIMLATFEGMTEAEILIMNAATGMCIVISVFVLGVSLCCRSKGFNT